MSRQPTATFYRVLYTDEQVIRPMRTRVWLECGVPLAIQGVLLTPSWDRYDDLYEACWLVRHTDGQRDVAPFAALALDELGDYRVIPRATREDAHGRMEAVLVEVQHVGPGRPIWLEATA